MLVDELYTEILTLVDRFHGSELHGDWCTAGCDAHTNFVNESICLLDDNVPNEVCSYSSQVTRDVENAVPLHVVIRHTGGSSDLTYEAVCMYICNLPVNYFLLVLLPFGGYSCKHCLSNSHRRKESQILRSGECSADISDPEDIGQSIHTYKCVWAVGESC
jgi:hypothetical protein